MSDQAHYSVFYCPICKLPVVLTAKTKTDDAGQAVHEHCYLSEITSKRQEQESADA